MLTGCGIFCAVAAYELYRFLGAPNGVTAVSALVAFYLLPAIVALWLVADAQGRGRHTLYDLGSFFFFLWPVLAPIYLFRTRGWRALGTIGLFFAVYLAAILFAVFMGYPASLDR